MKWALATHVGHALQSLRVTRVSVRGFIRTQSTSANGGPSQEKLRAIPFTQHVNAANKVFKDFHGSSFFSARVPQDPPQEVFLPFWIVSARVHTEIVQAQVGRSELRTHFNPATKRNETRWETDWAWVQTRHRSSREYVPTAHIGLQIYGSYKYRRSIVNRIRSGACLSQATVFSPQLMDRPPYTDMGPAYQTIQRTVDPFTIYPTTALRLAKAYIHDAEERYADDFLKRTYMADQTRFLKLDIRIEDVQVSPVYYPTYIYTTNYLGRNLRTFVNGYDLGVGGIHMYSWERVAAVSAVSMATVLTATGGIGWGGISGSFWIGVVLPTAATALLAMYFPLISLRVRDYMRQREIHSQGADPRFWDSEWIHAYNIFEEQKRYNAWRSSSSSGRYAGDRAGQAPSGYDDPKGYYRALNVSPQATTAEIQSAFRGLAMKYHPDRYADDEEKKKATAKFQVISEAYGVLRDAKKRRNYDATGHA